MDEAVSSGLSIKETCEEIGIHPRTLKRWRDKPEDGRISREQKPANRLSKAEEKEILHLLNSPEYKDLSPSQFVPILADQGTYLASESTIYRLLKREKMAAHRQPSRPPRHKAPEPFTATGPNQVWSWDITYIPTSIRGVFYYLYMICDIYSRKIVGWEVHEVESADFAARLVQQSCLKENIAGRPLVLHADNGGPMKGATMLATLQRLGVIPSFSRPSVSNDNPYSESLFRTLKYRPSYPSQAFENLDLARTWVADFVRWYNLEHRHSSLKFVTPDQRHRGLEDQVLINRDRVYQDARERHPERWARTTRDWTPADSVTLNPRHHDTDASQMEAVA